MTVALCTAASGPHTQLLDMAEPALLRYADRWGMTPVVVRNMQCDRPASWYKLLLISLMLGEEHETVVWVDADTLFVDFDRNILDPALPDRPLWMTLHKVPDGRTVPNCGVLIVHQHPRIRDFLNTAWAQTQYVDHPWWEQAAILHLLGWEVERPGGLANPPTEDTEWTPLVGWLGTEWNSMPLHDPHPHPVIKHYSGMGMPARVDQMRADLERVAA